MSLTAILLEIGIKILVGVVLVAFGSLILREIIAKIFGIEDDTMATASAVVIWTAVTSLIFSFFSFIPYLEWLLSILVNVAFILLVKKYYKTTWKTTVKVWGVWFATYFTIALVIAVTLSVSF